MVIRLLRKTATSRLGFLAAGAALMYLYDPDRGDARRARVSSQGQAMARRRLREEAKESEQKLRDLQGRLKGAAVRARGGGSYHPESDVDLREHLRQVISSLPVATSDITVDVADGKAALRGQVQSDSDRDAVCTAVAAVAGVGQVEDYLHLPGEPAPNKASVLSRS